MSNSVTKITIFPHGGKSENFFAIFTWPVRAKILSRFQFEGKTDVWISQIRRVKCLLMVLGFWDLVFKPKVFGSISVWVKLMFCFGHK